MKTGDAVLLPTMQLTLNDLLLLLTSKLDFSLISNDCVLWFSKVVSYKTRSATSKTSSSYVTTNIISFYLNLAISVSNINSNITKILLQNLSSFDFKNVI